MRGVCVRVVMHVYTFGIGPAKGQIRVSGLCGHVCMCNYICVLFCIAQWIYMTCVFVVNVCNGYVCCEAFYVCVHTGMCVDEVDAGCCLEKSAIYAVMHAAI